MRITVVGAGYVGLVTAVCLADKGHLVSCVDVDAGKIDTIRRGITPIYERGLEELLARNLGVRLQATTNLAQAVAGSELTMIAVGTPSRGRGIDLSQIREAARAVGAALRNSSSYHVVVVKSTVVPGTTDDVVRPLIEAASGRAAGPHFGLGMNPEFLTEGEAIDDFMAPDRFILGGMDERTLDTLAAVYAPFPGVEQLRTNNKTAEMIKYTSNALLATAISFSNEIANVCSALGGIDAAEVLRGLHLSKYLSPFLGDGTRAVAPITSFLWAGCGFGGSCLPKDVRALITHGQHAGQALPLLEAVMAINDHQPQEVIELLGRHFDSLSGLRVAVLGLAFRPGTDDMRESPALPIITALLRAGADIRAYDPVAGRRAETLIQDPRVVISKDLEDALTDVQAAVLVTRWDEFRRVPELLASRDPQPLVVDGRRMLDKHSVSRYAGIGL